MFDLIADSTETTSDQWQPFWLFRKPHNGQRDCAPLHSHCIRLDPGRGVNLSEQERDQTHLPEQIKHEVADLCS